MDVKSHELSVIGSVVCKSFRFIREACINVLAFVKIGKTPRHEDFQWRVANFLITFQLLTFAKFECATECAINSHANHSVGSPVAE